MLRSASGILGTVDVGNGFPREGTDGEWKIAGRDAILTMKDGIMKLATADGDETLPGSNVTAPYFTAVRRAVRGAVAIELGGWAIGLVGLFNIVGTLLWGWTVGRHPRKDLLALLYALRALAFVLFLALPLSSISVLVFAASLGFLWLGTVPLTSGLVAYMFGPTQMAMLWGIVFFSHQLGSFLGGWGAGRLYDVQGNYDLIWWVSV